MCSLNQLYLTEEQHVHSTPQVSVLARGAFAVGTGTSETGHWVGELASPPLAQVAPLWGCRGWHRAHGAHQTDRGLQTACDHNQQWQRTMNPIIYKKTVQVSFGFTLLSLFTPTLLLRGSTERTWPYGYSRQPDVFIVPRATLLFMLYSLEGRSASSCSLFPTDCTFREQGDILNKVTNSRGRERNGYSRINSFSLGTMLM